MAFSTSGNGFGGRGRFRGNNSAMSEINVVPLVDVVLVLLIIFMLTAHVMEFGLEVEVPKVNMVKDSADELPVVTLTAAGDPYLGESSVNINSLAEQLQAKYPGQRAVYVRADKNTIYDALAQVVSALGQAKYDVRLITQPVDEADRRRK